MFKVNKEEIDFGGKKIILETGKIARQADGAIIATMGETVVIATVVGAKKANPETDLFNETTSLRFDGLDFLELSFWLRDAFIKRGIFLS